MMRSHAPDKIATFSSEYEYEIENELGVRLSNFKSVPRAVAFPCC